MSGAAHAHGGDAPPPYTETDIYSNSGAAVPASTAAPPSTADDAASRMSSSNEEIIYTPPDTPRTTASLGALTGVPQPGAALYFETRPPPPPDVLPPSTVVHALPLETQSLPDDFPFPSDWEKRNVHAQDWATFVNFLLPDHTTRGNDVVLARKLRAEAESEAGDSVSSGGGRSQAELQRHLMRTAGPEALQDEAQRRANALATVQEWNAGFFGPRGITVTIASSGHDEVVYDEAPRGGQDRAAPAGNTWLPNQSSFRMDADGITYGKRFVMDSNGIRLGSLIMDANGIRMASHDNDAPGNPFDTAAGPSSRSMPGFPVPEPPRGRSAVNTNIKGKDKDTTRDRSTSSVSSASSASSSASASSLNSLPDYDEVREQQLPGYLGILRDWTARPNHVRTNADVQWLRNELKFRTAAPPRAAAAGDPCANPKELKAQIKTLLKQWKQIQREQRKTQRDSHGARKKQRRQEKRERKQWKRDMKRSHRDVRRAERDVRRHGGQMPPGPSIPPVPPGLSMPPMPPMPHGSLMPPGPCMPAMPAVPPMPAMPHGMGSLPSMRCHDHRPRQQRREHGHCGSRGSWPHHGRGGFGGGFGGFGRGGFTGAWPPPREPPTHTSWSSRHGPPPPAPTESPPPPAPNPATAAKYAAAQGIEDAIRTQQDQADAMADGPGKDAVHGAIASMTRSLEALRVDADAEYARHVAAAHMTEERSAITTGVYLTSKKDCLSFKSGAKITGVTFPSDEWWHGTYKGRSGYFPANSAKLVPL